MLNLRRLKSAWCCLRKLREGAFDKGENTLNKSITKRVSKLERRAFQPRWRLVNKDDGVYRGECGDGLPQDQFDAWVK
jgi:hypothetical protein